MTASHNPPEYNGYKVYGEDGGQLPPFEADQVIQEVDAIENELSISVDSEETLKQQGLIKIIGEEIDHAYIEKLKPLVCTLSWHMRSMSKSCLLRFMGQPITLSETGCRLLDISMSLLCLSRKNQIHNSQQ